MQRTNLDAIVEKVNSNPSVIKTYRFSKELVNRMQELLDHYKENKSFNNIRMYEADKTVLQLMEHAGVLKWVGWDDEFSYYENENYQKAIKHGMKKFLFIKRMGYYNSKAKNFYDKNKHLIWAGGFIIAIIKIFF